MKARLSRLFSWEVFLSVSTQVFNLLDIKPHVVPLICSILGVGCFGVVFSARVRRVDGAANPRAAEQQRDSENLALKIVLASDPQSDKDKEVPDRP